MLRIIPFFKKAVLVLMVLGIGFAMLPATAASAAGVQDEANPPADQTNPNTRLEKIWARMLTIYERQDKMLDRAEAFIDKVETLIERAEARGLDTSAVQAALEVFEDAVKDARQIHQSANGIVNSHKGFDDNGRVTDRAKAIETIQELGKHLKDFRNAIAEPFKALVEALRALRNSIQPSTQPAS